MDTRAQPASGGRQYHATLDEFAGNRLLVPQAHKCKQTSLADFKTVGLLDAGRRLPLVKFVSWDEAAFGQDYGPLHPALADHLRA